MKVFFDFYEIALGKGNSIGIYNYALAVLKTLAKNNNNISLIVACNSEQEKDLKIISNIKLVAISKYYPNYRQRFYWRFYKSIRLAKSMDADIYYSPKGFSPGFSKRHKKPYIVLTVHDMIPFHYLEHFPKYFNKFESFFVTKTLQHSLNIANQIITISNFSKQMIIEYKKNENNIARIYNGIALNTNSKFKHNNSPYIFAITSNLPHKNKDNIIKGYLNYCQTTDNPLKMKICGITEDDQNIVSKSENIEFIGFAEQEHFENLFSNASLLIFLPLIEGFGFPPLEAVSYGVPSVVSDIPVLREILDQSAFFVKPESPKEIGEGIFNVLSNSEISMKILENGKQTIAKYTWDKCCDQIAEVFEETIRNNNKIAD